MEFDIRITARTEGKDVIFKATAECTTPGMNWLIIEEDSYILDALKSLEKTMRKKIKEYSERD